MHTMRAHHRLNRSLFKAIISGILFSMLLMVLLVSNSFASRSYGPVKENDFLGKIVDKSYPQSSLNKNQIMVAILRANPTAFRGGNIHFLKQGATLILPSEHDIASITSAEASALIAKHLAFFKQGKTGHFVTPPLILTSVSKEESTDTDATNPDSNNLKQDKDNKESVTTTKTEKKQGQPLPPKIKIELRKEAQEKSNKQKQLETLEKINQQQTRTLTTLDQQIHILEEQLKNDARQKLEKEQENKKNQTVNAPKTALLLEGSEVVPEVKVEPEATEATQEKKPAVKEQNKDPASEDTIAENTISSLEAQLSKNTLTENKSVPETQQNTAPISEATNTSPSEAVKIPNTDTTHNIEIAATESLNTENQQQEVTETHPGSTTVMPAKSAPAANTTSSSVFNSISNPLLILFAALALGLLVLTYFLTQRSRQQDSSDSLVRTATTTTATPLQRETRDTTNSASLKMPDQEKLLNPVIKTDDIVNISEQPGEQYNNGTTSKSFSQQYQEAEIKINMARAYMDMGYTDASKEVLQEVLIEGSDEQKDTVRQMLSMI